MVGREGDYVRVLYEDTLGERKVVLVDQEGFVEVMERGSNVFMFITDSELYYATRMNNAYIAGYSSRLIYVAALYEASTRVFLACIEASCKVVPRG